MGCEMTDPANLRNEPRGLEIWSFATLLTGHGGKPEFVLKMTRGAGMLDGLDGVVSNNTFAAYTHIHALGATHWAVNFVRAAAAFKLAKGQ